MGYGSVLIFFIVGLLLTAIVQASSATFAIALVMCSKGWIHFDLAAALVLGGNIGTCVTPLLASISGNANAKRAACGHLLFNVFGSVWCLALYYPYMKFISWLTSLCAGDPNALYQFSIAADQSTVTALVDNRLDLTNPENAALAADFSDMQYHVSFGLSMFHTVFNVINITIMIWFTKVYVKIVTKMIPDRKSRSGEIKEEKTHLEFITAGLMSTSELSILQAHKEIVVMGERTHRMHDMALQMYREKDEMKFAELFARVEKYEDISDNMEAEIAAYLSRVADGKLSDDSKRQIQSKLREISEIESIADSYYNIARILKRRNENRIEFNGTLESNIMRMMSTVDKAFTQMLSVLKANDGSRSDLEETLNIEMVINSLRDELKSSNIIDLNEGKYPYSVGTVYMDIIGECEKIGDYIVNVVEAVVNIKVGKPIVDIDLD